MLAGRVSEPYDESLRTLCVKDVFVNVTWDFSTLEELLPNELALEISSLQISFDGRPDDLIWKPSKNGGPHGFDIFPLPPIG